MTRPTEVTVKVADLTFVLERLGDRGVHPHAVQEVVDRLVAAIPEPEWEPTAEMVQQYKRATDAEFYFDDDDVRTHLRALHREGLL